MINLLIYFLKKDIKSKYAGSGLGLLWAFILPLFQIFLFWFVFAGIFKARPYANTQMPYLYFLLSSFFFWLAFSDGLLRSSYAILENAEMVKKVSFPNIVLPLSVTLSSYIHHLIGFIIFITIYTATTSFSPSHLLVIPILFTQLVFSAGLGLIFASLMPYLRDLGQIMWYTLQGLFFLSPIMYSTDLIPKQFKLIILFNPFTYFAISYQKMILFNKPPELHHIAIIFLLALTAIIAGFLIFKKLREGFADVL